MVYRYRTNTFAEIKAIFSKNVHIRVFLADGFAFAVLDLNGKNVARRSAAHAVNDLDIFVMPQIGLIYPNSQTMVDQLPTVSLGGLEQVQRGSRRCEAFL